MQISSCFLDASNARVLEGRSVGDRIRERGKQQLWDDRGDCPIDTVVIHFISDSERNPTTPFSFDGIIRVFCDFGVSSHFLIERNGAVWQLAPCEKRAWHCGRSVMPPPDNRAEVNDFSIGIELVATEQSGYTDDQYASLCEVCGWAEGRFGALTYVGHEHIAGERAVQMGLRAEPKTDPGALFEWQRLGNRSCLI